MALIVEDGTGITNANSYASVADIRTYALNRGVTLSIVDSEIEVLAIKAMDYLDTQGLGLLSLSFPLDNDKLCGTIPLDQTMLRLSGAQCQLCIEQDNGVDLSPTATDAFITEETVGPLTTKYSDKIGGGAGTPPVMPTVDSLLLPLIQACGLPGLFTTVRV